MSRLARGLITSRRFGCVPSESYAPPTCPAGTVWAGADSWVSIGHPDRGRLCQDSVVWLATAQITKRSKAMTRIAQIG